MYPVESELGLLENDGWEIGGLFFPESDKPHKLTTSNKSGQMNENLFTDATDTKQIAIIASASSSANAL